MRGTVLEFERKYACELESKKPRGLAACAEVFSTFLTREQIQPGSVGYAAIKFRTGLYLATQQATERTKKVSD